MGDNKKLLVFDMEGTIFKTKIKLEGTYINSTIWQGIAHSLGDKAIKEEIMTHHKWNNGKYSNYLEWMQDTIQIHKKYKLNKKIFYYLINSAEYTLGVETFFNNLDRNKYVPIIISGGFANLAKRVSKDFNINHYFAACEYLFNEYGELSSYNLLPCDFNGKIEFINIMLETYKTDEWIFIGDGKNDILIAEKAPISIGFNPDEELKRYVDYIIYNFVDLKYYI